MKCRKGTDCRAAANFKYQPAVICRLLLYALVAKIAIRPQKPGLPALMAMQVIVQLVIEFGTGIEP